MSSGLVTQQRPN